MARVVSALIPLVALTAACPDPPEQPIPCTESADCPGALLCIGGVCDAPAGGSCTDDADCPADYICLENGRCRANAQCERDADCCPDPDACASTCESFQCIGTACDVGDAEDCFVGCHRGQRTCVNGNWSLCDALEVTDSELCGDGEDNDCNGQKDEGCAVCTAPATRACEAPCGSEGVQECQVDGTWGPCDTDDGCACNPAVDTVRTIACGNCGFRDSSCADDGLWADDEVCQSEGACAPDEVETVPCGDCGVQTRTCGADCSWGPLSACAVPSDACVPDAVVTEGCGTCGTQTRTCGDDCTLGAPSACVEGSGCTEGQQQVQECGRCGEKIAVCDDTCRFGAFGACQSEGTCTPGEIDVEECGDCGYRERVCGDDCEFGVYGACQDQGECTPDEEVTETCGPSTTVGPCEQGTRTKVCNDSCRFEAAGDCVGAVFPRTEVCGNGVDEDCSGADLQVPDQFEDNDSCGAAFRLRNPDGTDDPFVYAQPTYDSVDDDADFFFFHGIDNTGLSTEHIIIDLTNIPTGMDLDLKLYRNLADCQSDTPLATSLNLDNADEHIDWSEAFGTSDDSDYFIKVVTYFTPSCTLPYRITVNGLR